MKIKIEYRVVNAPILPANLKSTDLSITINIKPIKREKRLKSQNSLIVDLVLKSPYCFKTLM
jgi:hypothetical protein